VINSLLDSRGRWEGRQLLFLLFDRNTVGGYRFGVDEEFLEVDVMRAEEGKKKKLMQTSLFSAADFVDLTL
jgi:hypothetical protein